VDAATPSAERLNMTTMRRIADETGGRADAVEISPTFGVTAHRRRAAHEYLLSYSTMAAKDGRAHAIASTSAGVEGRSGEKGIRRRLGEAAFSIFASARFVSRFGRGDILVGRLALGGIHQGTHPPLVQQFSFRQLRFVEVPNLAMAAFCASVHRLSFDAASASSA